MKSKLAFPIGKIDLSSNEKRIDSIEMMADYFELSTFFSDGCISFPANFDHEYEMKIDDTKTGVKNKFEDEDGLLRWVERKIVQRKDILKEAYPFKIDEEEEILYFQKSDFSYGQVAYLLPLILANIGSSSSMLHGTSLYPVNCEIIQMRRYFECIGAAAMAAEINGKTWAVGSPRPDGSSFFDKLTSIADTLGFIKFKRKPYARGHQQDGGIDVFAAHMYPDGLPGFLTAIAQVASGKNWEEKAKSDTSGFMSMWFMHSELIVTQRYNIIPFSKSEGADFSYWCHEYGLILHRMRLPLSVEQAFRDRRDDISDDIVGKIDDAHAWLKSYRRR